MAAAKQKSAPLWRRRVLLGLGFASALGLAAFLEAQFWQDGALRDGWRLQVHGPTARCRIVAPDGAVARRGFGSGCEAAFAALGAQADPAAQAEPEELVLLIHGLGRTPRMFRKLQPALEAPGRRVVVLRYASLAADIRGHGDWLNRLLDGHPPVRQVSFVTHSLGGMALRAALEQDPAWRCRLPIGAVVMLAPPNRGALIARKLDRWTPTALILGPSFADLAGRGPLPAILPEELPLAIIAGGFGGKGVNPLLPGDNDGIVQVAETRMAGADVEILVRALHTFIANDEVAIDAIRSFLESPLSAPKTADGCL